MPDFNQQPVNSPNPSKPSKTTRLLLHENILATASGGMAIALGTALSILTLIKMPQGGSMTVGSMLPIIFCALAFGPGWGIGIGAVYGLLQFYIAPFAAQWAQILLDYPIAFGFLGLAGFFARPKAVRMAERNILHRVGSLRMDRIAVAVIVAMSGRLASHILSGVVFFGEYAPEGQNVWVYSALYNATYMVPEMVITCLILIPLAAVIRPRSAKNGRSDAK